MQLIVKGTGKGETLEPPSIIMKRPGRAILDIKRNSQQNVTTPVEVTGSTANNFGNKVMGAMESKVNARHRRLRSQDIMMDLSFVRLKEDAQVDRMPRNDNKVVVNKQLVGAPAAGGVTANIGVRNTLLPSLLGKQDTSMFAHPNGSQPASPAETSYIAERSDIIESSATSVRGPQGTYGSSFPPGGQMVINTDYRHESGVDDTPKELNTAATTELPEDRRSMMLAVPGGYNPSQTLVAHQVQQLSPKPPQYLQ